MLLQIKNESLSIYCLGEFSSRKKQNSECGLNGKKNTVFFRSELSGRDGSQQGSRRSTVHQNVGIHNTKNKKKFNGTRLLFASGVLIFTNEQIFILVNHV